MTRTNVAFPMPELRRLARQIAKRPGGASHAWMCSAWQVPPHQVNTRLDAMRRAGLVDVRYQLFMFGTIGIHSGRKPE